MTVTCVEWRGDQSSPCYCSTGQADVVYDDVQITCRCDTDELQHEPITLFTVDAPASASEQRYNLRCVKASGDPIVSLGIGTCLIVEEL